MIEPESSFVSANAVNHVWVWEESGVPDDRLRKRQRSRECCHDSADPELDEVPSVLPHSYQKYGGFSGSSISFTNAILAVSFSHFTPQILTAGEYGISLSHSLVFVAPISPRSTTSPGAVGRPGARRNILQIASMYARSRIAPLC